MATSTKTPALSRRQALSRGAAAGAVIWSVPMVMSTKAHAEGGSNGSEITGAVSSVTCVWNQRFWRAKAGTAITPEADVSNDTFCEVNSDGAWRIIAWNDSFTVRSGHVLKFRPMTGQFGNSRVAQVDEGGTVTDETVPATTATETTVPESTVPATTIPIAPAIAPPAETVATTAAPTTPENTASPTTSPSEAVAPTPVAEAENNVAPAPAPEPPPTEPVEAPAAVETIVIDMSGRTDLNIGDVYGFFQIVDAAPA